MCSVFQIVICVTGKQEIGQKARLGSSVIGVVRNVDKFGESQTTLALIILFIVLFGEYQ
jgi:hypothetical protein